MPLKCPGLAAVVLAIMTAPLPAGAHHSFAPKYDPAKTVRMTGIIGGVHLQNPHSSFQVSSGGKTWLVETEGVAAAKAAGLHTGILVDGAKVTVSGWPARDGSAALGLRTITIGGTTLTLRRSAR